MRRIYRLVARFPGIIQPTYSEEEYRKVVQEEQRTLMFVIPFICLCLGAGLVFFALTIIEVEKIKKEHYAEKLTH
jgi:hypothetical protein